MKRLMVVSVVVALALAPALAGPLRRAKDIAKTVAKAASKAAKKSSEAVAKAAGKAVGREDYWVKPMRAVHAKFTGKPGTFAHFGDSITVSMAFWASLKWSHKNMDARTQKAFELVRSYMADECWAKWKGPQYGNNGGMTMRWCMENCQKWLRKLNPEVVLIMFGTNDLGGVKVADYEKHTRQAVLSCLENGSVVILSTIPPRHGYDAKVKQFVEVTRKVARELKVPLCDYYKAIMDRRPEDWSGRLEKFKNVPGGTYEVPTLIARDGVHPSNPRKWRGDYSKEGLKHNGFVLRNYVVLHSYAEVIRKVLKPKK